MRWPNGPDLLTALASAVGADANVVVRFGTSIVPAWVATTTMTLTAEGAPPAAVASLVTGLAARLEVAGELTAKVSVFVDRDKSLDVARAVACAAGARFSRTATGYRIE